MQLDPNLEEYATDKQWERYRLACELGVNATDRKLGLAQGSTSKSIKALGRRAAKAGYAPQQGLTHPAAPGFATKRVSTAYREDGSIALQWHIQEPERRRLEEMLDEWLEGAANKLSGLYKPSAAPATDTDELMANYIIGDHHLGMYAWGDETGDDNWDLGKGCSVLSEATENLVARAPACRNAALINVGDFLHANDTTSLTPASKHLLDTDGRHGKVIRHAGELMVELIERMLAKHEIVTVINARGNHDPDAAIYLNEALRLAFAGEPRVRIKDNFNKFQWLEFGKNLIVVHHGDKIKRQAMYEAVTRNLPEEWGRSTHRFGWTGHVHHKQAEELGGMLFEVWNVLPPPDAWHAGSGYGSERSMTCVVLHQDGGEHHRIVINAQRLQQAA